MCYVSDKDDTANDSAEMKLRNPASLKGVISSKYTLTLADLGFMVKDILFLVHQKIFFFICVRKTVMIQLKPSFLFGIEMIGDVDINEEWGPCPMTMVKNHKRYIGTVCRGKAGILQAPGSEVSLDIPYGSKGVYVMGTHLDFSRFNNVVEDKECFVSPVVEIEHKSFDNGTTDKDSHTLPHSHTLTIPHCLRERWSKAEFVNVQRGKPSNTVPFEDVLSVDETHSIDQCYFIDSKNITILSREFSEFICTSCNTTCQGTIKLLLFGKFNTWRKKEITTAQMKSFLCSPLFRIAEFRDVSCFD